MMDVIQISAIYCINKNHSTQLHNTTSTLKNRPLTADTYKQLLKETKFEIFADPCLKHHLTTAAKNQELFTGLPDYSHI